MRIGIVLERFYSGQRNGPVTVREGAGGVKKRPARTSLCFVQAGGKGNRGGHGSEYSQIALTILEDALGDQASALKTHEYFSRRVVAQFPERWTISRSRVLAYVNTIEREKPRAT
jgi:Family of unknown function (DUF6166)